jgi:hypothetical protein
VEKKISSLRLLLPLLSYIDVKFGVITSLENHGEKSLSYPHKTEYFLIDNMAMTRYIIYKHKIINMKDKRFPKIDSNSSQNHLLLKRVWHKDVNSWLNHWGIKEVIMQNIDTIKITITSKFKEKLWCNKELEDKRKLRYYKYVINPNIEYQKYLSIITSVKNKINNAKITMNETILDNS